MVLYVLYIHIMAVSVLNLQDPVAVEKPRDFVAKRKKSLEIYLPEAQPTMSITCRGGTASSTCTAGKSRKCMMQMKR
jgi:hypothetical protein